MTEPLIEHHVLEYPGGYTRSVGPVIGRFLTGLRDGRIVGVRARRRARARAADRVRPDDERGGRARRRPLDRGRPARHRRRRARGSREPRAGQAPRSTKPFAFALIRPDGADTAMLHVVDCGVAPTRSASACASRRAGAAERVGYITDIEAWVPLGDGEEPQPAPLHAPAEDEQPVTGITCRSALEYEINAGWRPSALPARPRRGQDHRRDAPSSSDRCTLPLARHRPDDRRADVDRGRGAATPA